MYISVKLPPAFGYFNRIRRENYPFNGLFTAYLAAVSRLGLSLGIDVEELVGYIEDRVFDGQRLPDVPDEEGEGPVSFRYKTDDPDVTAYIGQAECTNRAAVMYIARMTLRLSAAYGTSLFRLTRLIADLGSAKVPDRRERAKIEPEKKPVSKPVPKPVQEKQAEPEQKKEPEKEAVPMPRVTSRAPEQPAPMQESPQTPAMRSAQAAKAALAELTELTDQAEGEVVQTNPLLSNFL